MAFEDGMRFLSFAGQALSRDEFSKCFEPKPTVQPQSMILYWLYIVGVFIRYGILFPIRFTVFLTATAIFLSSLPLIMVLRSVKLMRLLFRWYCKAWLFAFSAIIRHHGVKPKFREAHLFVANHTSFIDFFLMSAHEFVHATVAQTHGGLFGWFQKYALSLNGSLFFNRSEQRDRLAVARRMQAHINKVEKTSPLIIFPEGTCVNNEATVLFHKGAFELDAWICPVAIKYNKRLLDPYWNTREQTFTQHALYLMTRWFMVADVYWLPPQRRRTNLKGEAKESSIEFANRVKGMISHSAGLKNLSWDGYMKNNLRTKDGEKMRRCSQEKYVSVLRRRLTPGPPLTEDGSIEQGVVDTNVSSAMNISFKGRKRSQSFTIARSMGDNSDGVMREQDNLYLPNWLPDTTVVDIKNKLLMARKSDGDQSQSLIKHMNKSKEGVIATWSYYSRCNRQTSPIPVEGHITEDLPNEDGHVAERRLENSSWRVWFKQRQNERPPSEDPFPMDIAT